jgi:arylsulfatase A-like enzyme
MHPFDNGEMNVRDELISPAPRSVGEVRRQLSAYYGMIAHLDHAVGRVMRILQARGMDERTVVIYTADHGLAVGQHGLMGKQNLYEPSLRIPLMMAGPGIPQGEVNSSLAWHADTCATIRAIAGLDPDPAREGVDMLADPATAGTGRHEFGAAFGYGQRMYRNDRFKLIRYYPIPAAIRERRSETTPGSHVVQLFDLEQDPDELHNLADLQLYGPVRRDLEAGLALWQESVADPLLSMS